MITHATAFQYVSGAFSFSFTLLFVQIIGIYLHKAASECDPDVGPAGGTICLLDSPPYDQAQYATCVSHEYILQKSFGEQGCNDSVSYCYYPCMLERYGVDEGAVERDCTCDVGGSVGIMTGLSVECRIPALSDCSWYNNCVKRYYHCSVRQEYSLGFGETTCRLYSQSCLGASPCGMEWLKSVTQCILVQTSSLMRAALLTPNNSTDDNKSCELLEPKISKIHTSCYEKSYSGFTICELESVDFATVFFSLKALQPFLENQFAPALKYQLLSRKNCEQKIFASNSSQEVYLEIASKVRVDGTSARGESVVNFTLDSVAERLMQRVSDQLRWTAESYTNWFAYASDNLKNNFDVFYVQLFLSDVILDSCTSSQSSNDFENRFSGLIRFVSEGTTLSFEGLNIELLSLALCEPFSGLENCSSSKFLAFAYNYTTSKESLSSTRCPLSEGSNEKCSTTLSTNGSVKGGSRVIELLMATGLTLLSYA